MPLAPTRRQALPGRLSLQRLVRCRGCFRQEGGSSIIETAFILPVVFLMIFGFIDFCLIVFGMGNANFAGRAALRYATLHSSTSYKPTTQQDLNNIVSPYIFKFPANTWSVSASYYAGNVVSSGVYVTVSVTYGFKIFGRTYNGISYSTTGCGSVQQ